MAIVIPREQVLYVKAEATAGTLTAPAAGDAVILAGNAVLNQTTSYTDSEEIANSRSILDQAQDVIPAGTFTFSTYVRPSGTKGTKPAEAELWRALLGVETDGADDVTYTCAVAKPTLSLWWKSGNTVLFARGAYVTGAKLTSSAKGFPMIEWSGVFSRLGWCGANTLSGAVDGTPAPAASIVVHDARNFAVGALVKVGTDDNGGAGYAISTVTVGTNTLGLTPSIDTDQLDDAAVIPFLPAATYATSDAQEARTGALTIASAARTYRSFELTIEDPAEYIVDEVTTTDYPADAVPGLRRCSGKVDIVLRDTDLYHFEQALADATVALVFSVGGVATSGDNLTINLPQTRIQVPEVGEAGPAMGLSIAFTALATTAGEDELSVVYS